MSVTTIPYQIVIFTQQYSISGTIFLHEQRLSDFLNDRREKNILLRNASVARLENPTTVIENTLASILPKSGIVLAFEPPQKTVLPARFIKYPKEKFPVFLVLDGMEVHGDVHVPGSFDLLTILADAGDTFLPITNASVTIEGNPDFVLTNEAVVVNPQHIRLIGEVATENPTEPKQ